MKQYKNLIEKFYDFFVNKGTCICFIVRYQQGVSQMNEIKEKINIANMIYEIRGKQVMLDSEISVTK